MNNETWIISDTSLVGPVDPVPVLHELCQVLTRRGCALIFDPERGMVLCSVINNTTGVAIAVSTEIKPGEFKYKPIKLGATFQRKGVQ